MGWVRLTEDYGDHKAGEVVDLPAVIDRKLKQQGKALGGRAVIPGWQPQVEHNRIKFETRDKPKRETIHPKPLNGTVKEIKKWLDRNGVEYNSTARKAELLGILEDA